jgi:ssDNA-binding Zn-finger/Zn-ribbon topoisomerase 1
MWATKAESDPQATCPDCGTNQMWLREGRHGRYYSCQRSGCKGTLGARLDGTPRKPRGSPALLEARKRAMTAIQRLTAYRDAQLAERVAKRKSGCGDWGYWWNEREGCASIDEDIRAIVHLANLPHVVAHRSKPGKYKWSNDYDMEYTIPASYHLPGLFLRRRTIEECAQIVEAVDARLQAIRRADDRRLRAERKNAWDRVLVYDLGELIEDDDRDQGPGASFPF